jgi:DNA polymerase III subunit alpha
LQIEDLTGKAEAVVFPKSFDRVKDYLNADQRLMVWGKVDRRDDQVQLIVEDAEPIEAVRMVMVQLSPQEAGDIEVQHRLREVLVQQAGENAKVPVVATILASDRRQFVRLGSQFRVQNPQQAVTALAHAGFQAQSTALASA